MINSCILCLTGGKYYIYIYSDKQLFIDIPLGSQDQQVNMTPDSVQSRMRSFWGRISNSIAWKIFSPASLYSPGDASTVGGVQWI